MAMMPSEPPNNSKFFLSNIVAGKRNMRRKTFRAGKLSDSPEVSLEKALLKPLTAWVRGRSCAIAYNSEGMADTG